MCPSQPVGSKSVCYNAVVSRPAVNSQTDPIGSGSAFDGTLKIG